VEHAYPIVTRMAESRPEEAVVASRYNFRVVTTGQEFVSVSDYPTCMVRGPHTVCNCERASVQGFLWFVVSTQGSPPTLVSLLLATTLSVVDEG